MPSPTRRSFMLGTAGALAATLAARLSERAARADEPGARPAAPAPAATSCILLWLNGGPSHIDTFDPKPGAKSGGPFKAIASRATGVRLCEHLPRLAEQAQHLAFVRGLSTKEGSHPRAQLLVHTGHVPNPTVVAPSLGSWIARELGKTDAALPPFVSLGGPGGGPGFLGQSFGPLVVQSPGAMPQDLAPALPIGPARDDRRRGLLDEMERGFAARTGDGAVGERRAVYARATRLAHAPERRVFEIDDEPEAVRAAYGDTDFGRGCLVARRLVETGVPFVEVTLDGWDTHKDNFGRTKKLMGALDPAFATLVRELVERDLYRRTVVLCIGEFGRTPSIGGDDGRDHHPAAFSAVVGGGGLRGGLALGQTDAEGARVVADGTSLPDLFATIVARLGLDPGATRTSPLGRPIAITDGGTPIARLSA